MTTITIPAETEELIEDVIRRLEEFGDIGAEIIEDLRELLELF
ncbi:MAG TPA: hypothetical protein VHF27_02515 [Acidimicrobiales bacterium]|nr:hypothetical protein [Acidimicrobiales bacterium]